MALFECQIVDSSGKRQRFVREAVSEDALLRELSRETLSPLRVTEIEASRRGRMRRRRYSRSAISEFTSAMELLLSSGLTMRDALDVAQTIYRKGEVNRLVVSLLEELERGTSVLQALEALSASLPPVFVGFVRIGERLGSLEGSFRRIAEYMGEQKRLRERIASALIYPAVVVTVALAGVIGITFFVLPQIGTLFEQLGAGVPPAVIRSIQVFRTTLISGCSLLALVLAGIPLVALLRRSEVTAEAVDGLLLRVPGLGSMMRLRETLNFVFAMETLTAGGFAVEEALAETAGVLANRWLRAGVLRSRDRVLTGQDVSVAFAAETGFSDRLKRWLAIGDRTGNVRTVFGQLRIYYQGELEKWSARLMNLIEPILILAVGLILVVIITVFVVPLFSIYGSIL